MECETESTPIQRGHVPRNLHRESINPDRAGGGGADDTADLSRQEESSRGDGDILVWHGALRADLGCDGGDPAPEPLNDLRHDWSSRE
jgi:hypothetical protein